ncbi:MAG: type I-E CRISPR-associated protein Cse1/CasA [Chloroflexi bacterium]|nr:type I-E CRISPR-associated protein Cse1/CasA [Chloroflexota bacterium]
MPEKKTISFNLWTEPWMEVETLDGKIEAVGIETCLLNAHKYKAIFDASPLVVTGIHRLMIAILQHAISPKKKDDLRDIWKSRMFLRQQIIDFGKQYSNRFDLFSESAPFLQSSDLAIIPGKKDKVSSVSRLTYDIPSGTYVNHYYHGNENDFIFCPACVAKSMTVFPAFATAGGRPFKTSINGVPPIYILPGGSNLFESLTASLALPDYQPQVRSKRTDKVWWTRENLIEYCGTTLEVGYLHSLTFTARKIRVHPILANETCTRCGLKSEHMVRTITFEMGESRPKDAPSWFDPFAAYRIDPQKGPTPVRPVEGKAAWREFAALFLNVKPVQTTGRKGKQIITKRPSILEQIAELGMDDLPLIYPFRCVGLRTDMKAKVFEWMDASFDVPLAVLRDDVLALEARDAIDFASECRGVITYTFREYFGGKAKKNEKHLAIKNRMEKAFWISLAEPFRKFILKLTDPARHDEALKEWAGIVVNEARNAFEVAIESTGDDTATLAQRVKAEKWSHIRLNIKRKEYLHE